MSVAMTIDLTGQVAADAMPQTHFSGITGISDFMRGAVQSPGGKSILMLPSTAMQGKKSRIVPMLEDTAVAALHDSHRAAALFGRRWIVGGGPEGRDGRNPSDARGAVACVRAMGAVRRHTTLVANSDICKIVAALARKLH